MRMGKNNFFTKLILGLVIFVLTLGSSLVSTTKPVKAESYTGSFFKIESDGSLSHTYTETTTNKVLTRKYSSPKQLDVLADMWTPDFPITIFGSSSPTLLGYPLQSETHPNNVGINNGTLPPLTSSYYLIVERSGDSPPKYTTRGMAFQANTLVRGGIDESQRYFKAVNSSGDSDEVYKSRPALKDYINYINARSYSISGIGSGVISQSCAISGKISINYEGQLLGKETEKGSQTWPDSSKFSSSFLPSAQLWYKGPEGTQWMNTGELTDIENDGSFTFEPKTRETGTYIVTSLIYRQKSDIKFQGRTVNTTDDATNKDILDPSYVASLIPDAENFEGFFGKSSEIKIERTCSDFKNNTFTIKSVGMSQVVADQGTKYCKPEMFGILNIPGTIRYALCIVGEMFINLGTWFVNLCLDTLMKAAQVSTEHFKFEIIETAYAQSPPSPAPTTASTLAEAIRADSIKTAWLFSMSFVDIAVILMIIIVAFSQILNIQIDSYTVKKALPGLVIGIIGANLSYFMILGMLDISNVLNVEIIKRIGGKDELARGLATLMGFDPTLTGGGAIAGMLGAFLIGSFAGVIIVIFLALLLYIVPGFLILLLSILLYARMYMMFLLVIVAPMAFVSLGIPPANQYFKIWWKNLFNWVAVAPVIFFVLALGAAFKSTGLFSASMTGNDGTRPFELSNFGEWVLGVVLLWAAFTIPLKMVGGPVASAISSFANKAIKGSQKMAMGAASNKLNRDRYLLNTDRKEMQRLRDMQKNNKLTDPKDIKKLEALQKKYNRFGFGADTRLNAMAGLTNFVSIPTDYTSGRNAAAEFYKKKSSNESVTSGAFGRGAGDDVRKREKARVQREEQDVLDIETLKGMTDEVIGGKRLAQWLKQDENKDLWEKSDEWKEINGELNNTDEGYKNAWRKYNEKIKDVNLIGEPFDEADGKFNTWYSKNAIGAYGAAVDSGTEVGISEDDAIQEAVRGQLILAKSRSAYNRTPNPLHDMYDDGLHREARRRKNSGNPYAEEDETVFSDFELDPQISKDLVAKVRLIPNMDEQSMNSMLGIFQRGIKKSLTQEQINNAKGIIKKIHSEHITSVDKELDSDARGGIERIVGAIETKQKYGGQINREESLKEIDGLYNKAKIELNTQGNQFRPETIDKITEAIGRVGFDSDVLRSQLASTARSNPDHTIELLKQCRTVLATENIDLESAVQTAKTDLLSKRMASELPAIQSQQQGTLNQEQLDKITAILAHTARNEKLDLGQHEMSQAVERLVNEFKSIQGQTATTDVDSIKKIMLESLTANQKPKKTVQPTYGDGAGI